MTDSPQTLTRRDMIVTMGAAVAAAALPGVAAPAGAAAPAASPPRFLTPDEFVLLDELTDLIIPTDAHSPGARLAGVAAYIDGRLAESVEPEWQARWRSGLAAVDALSRDLHGRSFLQATADERTLVLTRMAAGEADPKTLPEHFFRELKALTVRGYYTSKIGIHVDQAYKGNVYQTGEYAGFDAK